MSGKRTKTYTYVIYVSFKWVGACDACECKILGLSMADQEVPLLPV